MGFYWIRDVVGSVYNNSDIKIFINISMQIVTYSLHTLIESQIVIFIALYDMAYKLNE